MSKYKSKDIILKKKKLEKREKKSKTTGRRDKTFELANYMKTTEHGTNNL